MGMLPNKTMIDYLVERRFFRSVGGLQKLARMPVEQLDGKGAAALILLLYPFQ